MRKQIVRFAIVLLVLWILCTLSVVAAPPGIDRSCRLSLQYAHDGEALNGAEVSVYRVAQACGLWSKKTYRMATRFLWP